MRVQEAEIIADFGGEEQEVEGVGGLHDGGDTDKSFR